MDRYKMLADALRANGVSFKPGDHEMLDRVLEVASRVHAMKSTLDKSSPFVTGVGESVVLEVCDNHATHTR